jgi:hypothetical protein
MGAEGGMIDYGAWVLAHLESKLAQYSGKVKSGISRGIHFFVKKGPHPWSPYFDHAFRGEMAYYEAPIIIYACEDFKG